MLIGVSGYIGSGKDTVAMLIQALTTENTAGVTGQGGYAARPLDYLKNYEGRPNLKGGYQIKKFAGKLKQIVSLLTGILIEDLEKQSVKDSELGPEWSKFTRVDAPHLDTLYLEGSELIEHRMTVRSLLQKLGTDAMRDRVHPNIHVNALFADYKFEGCKPEGCDTPNGSCNSPLCYPNWIISDTRFPNEAQAIKDRGGIVIRINRYPELITHPPINSDLPETREKLDMSDERHKDIYQEIISRLHSSETSLDNWEFDYTIDNSGTLEELLEAVRTMLLHFKIIS